jgi:hypothetical protein
MLLSTQELVAFCAILDSIQALFRLYSGSIKPLLRTHPTHRCSSPFSSAWGWCCGCGAKRSARTLSSASIKALFSLCSGPFNLYLGSIQPLLRLYSGCIKTLFSIYPASVQPLFSIYSGVRRLHSAFIEVY